MATDRKINRRKFILLAGGAVGASVLCCGGVTALGLSTAGIDYIETECGAEGSMGKRILVAYASKCGSTGEVAQAVGEVLCAQGAQVDVRKASDVRDLKGYAAVVLGSALRMEKVLPEADQFARRFRKPLQTLPVAYFSTGVGMVDPTPDNVQKTEKALATLKAVREPVAVGMFAGKVDQAKLEPLWRMMLSFVKEGPLSGGDWRDWAAIRAWAQTIAPSLMA